MHEQELWSAVLNRDKQYDGRFVFAVRSTGVYCRPSCPSRRPRRENVRFFPQAVEAERAGFRACRRCRPDQAASADPRLELVQQVCEYLAEPRERIPTLDELGQRFHSSPYHLQRTFKRVVGVTPREYAEAQRLERFRDGLKNGDTVTGAVYAAGYPSSSSLYRQVSERLGMTPKQYQNGGPTIKIRFSVAPCPLGWLLAATTEKGICAVRLGDSEAELEKLLRAEFPAAVIQRDDAGLGRPVAALLGYMTGAQPELALPLDVRATAFQRRVWQALRAIPYGSTRSYRDIAQAIGQPRAVRAVAHACALNPAALVIPCHRVVREDGSLGGYRWGLERKRALLEQESQG